MKNNSHLCQQAKIIKGTWVEDGLCEKCSKYLKQILDEQNKIKIDVVLENRRYTNKDSDNDILLAINKLAGEKTIRSLNEYEVRQALGSIFRQNATREFPPPARKSWWCFARGYPPPVKKSWWRRFMEWLP